MKYNQESFRIKYDYSWIYKQPLLTRVAVHLFRNQINIIAKHVLTTACERSIIKSNQIHELAAIFDRVLYPVKQSNRVVQKNIVCAGDVAGGDIYK